MNKSKSPTGPSIGKGETIESVCMIMAILSVIGGVFGALMFGSSAGPYSRGGYIIELVVIWIVGGVLSALFWYVLSGLGVLIQWREFEHFQSQQKGRGAP